MPKAFPGYYFDSAQGKFFKILPNHIAPKDSKYSQDAVKASIERDKVRTRLKHRQRQLRSLIQHPPILRHASTSALAFEREIYGEHYSEGLARIWAAGLQRRKLLDIEECEFTHFVRDEATGLILTASHFPDDPDHTVEQRFLLPFTPCTADAQLKAEHPSRKRPCFLDSAGSLSGPRSQLSSCTISPSHVILSTTYSVPDDSSNCNIFLTRLIEPDEYMLHLDAQLRLDSLHGKKGRRHWPSAWVQEYCQSWQSKSFSTFYDSAAGPHLDIPTFAVAANDGVLLIRGLEGDDGLVHKTFFPADENPERHFLTVDFLDHNVVLAGCRDATVRLWDTRSQDSTTRLQHPSCVAHVRATAAAHVLVVAGLRNQLCTYDLRFARPESSLPLVTFPEYKNEATVAPSLGFDVHRKLVAAATDDRRFLIFDANTGREAHQVKEADKLDGLARCIKFVDDAREGDQPRLLVGHGVKFDEWGW